MISKLLGRQATCSPELKTLSGNSRCLAFEGLGPVPKAEDDGFSEGVEFGVYGLGLGLWVCSFGVQGFGS